MKSKGGLILTVVILALIVILAGWGIKVNNNLVVKDEGVKTAWSQVENQYQRRADLIPNLVNTVKGYAAHERETLEAVINARSKATQTTVDPTNMTPEAMQEYMKAQGELSQALGRLMVTVERYPDLKANENFLALQTQLEGTENRISTERMRFNEVTKEYNMYARRFPTSVIANILGFTNKPYFEAEEGAEKAPEVQF